jgi:uncharacterized protein (DUF1800 family)
VALNRFGLGARPGDVSAIGSNPHGWVLDQIARLQADPVPGVGDTPGRLHLMDAFSKAKQEADREDAARAAVLDGTAKPGAPAAPPAAAKPRPPILDQPPGKVLENDLARRIDQAVATDWPVSERLAAFWANHFSVTNLRGEIAVTALAYENEAIRPNVFGTFHDMLCATAVHPAMTFYLDAASSVGPDSPWGLKHKRAVNENFAREVMELHTLGVNGGYTQADVQQLALALTGLGLDKAAGESAFYYDRHEPGDRVLLGRKLPADGDQMREAFAILANHPATIRHICRKLAVHFCGDTPPPALLKRLADAWRQGGGALPAVYRALANAPELWVARPLKYRSPQDFVLASGRAFGLHGKGRALLEEMRQLGEMPYGAPAPTGWPDQDSVWLDPGGAVGRVASARRMAALAGPDVDAAGVLPQVVYATANSVTFDVVLAEPNPRNAAALVLVCPEFQRR